MNLAPILLLLKDLCEDLMMHIPFRSKALLDLSKWYFTSVWQAPSLQTKVSINLTLSSPWPQNQASSPSSSQRRDWGLSCRKGPDHCSACNTQASQAHQSKLLASQAGFFFAPRRLWSLTVYKRPVKMSMWNIGPVLGLFTSDRGKILGMWLSPPPLRTPRRSVHLQLFFWCRWKRSKAVAVFSIWT